MSSRTAERINSARQIVDAVHERDHDLGMLTKPLLLTIIAACSVTQPTSQTAPPGASAQPDCPTKLQPPPQPPQREETYWCCETLSSTGKGKGVGCEQILHTVVGLCDKVLHCTEGYTNDDGTVTCT